MRKSTGVIDIRVESVSRGVVQLSVADRQSKRWLAPIHLVEGDSVRATFYMDENGFVEEDTWVKGRFVT